MLTFYGSNTKGPIDAGRDPAKIPDNVTWIDAFEPSHAEMGYLHAVMKTTVPSHDDLIEIESSSRLASDGEALVMSLPATSKDETGYPIASPVGFVVTVERVVTIRFAHLRSFEHLVPKVCAKGELSHGGYGSLVTILETMIDNVADLLERIGGDFDQMSRQIFASGIIASRKGRRPRQANEELSRMLQMIGRDGDLVSKVTETMLGLSRMLQYIAIRAEGFLDKDLKRRIETANQDAKSLHEFQEHLAGKTQFLLDTLLGLANIEQNNIFRLLTVVSVVGIPPTFFASMYGMNFKNMPELEWPHGYAFGLTLIFLSGVVPAIWFKVKGWW